MCFTPVKVRGRYVACRKCPECRINYSNTWAFRVGLEASLYESNCFITLTYSDSFLPSDRQPCKRDLQLFIKRLRKSVPFPIRYFACGEKGSKRLRPHYHIIVFGLSFDDLVFLKRDKKGIDLFRSPKLESLWTFGFSSVIPSVNVSVAKYCCKYFQKSDSWLLMSRKPAIGWLAFKPEWLSSDKLYLDGRTCRIPDTFLNKSDPSLVQSIHDLRSSSLSRFHFPDRLGFPLFDDQAYQSYLSLRKKQFYSRFPSY